MRVRCVVSSGDGLPESCIETGLGISAETVFPLTVGRLYSVFAVTTFKCNVWYYVFGDDDLPYPVWRLAPLFEVADPTIPASWEYGYVRRDMSDPGFPLVSFPEWAADHFFYERLVDGDKRAADILASRRLEIEAVE